MTDKSAKITTGGCFCGAVRYEIKGPLRGVVNCHCSECRRLNGNYGSHSKARKNNIKMTKDDGLAWFKISDATRRGFCRDCGSSLFWELIHQDSTGIIAGTIDCPTGLKTIGHIFVKDKSDFYEITDDLEQFQQSSNGKFTGDYV